MLFKNNAKKKITDGTRLWVNYIKNRIKQNKNFLGVFIGQTGSGKSLASIELGDLIENGNLPKENILFKASKFLARLDDGLNDKTLPKGSVIIWDEAGIGLNAKKWQSKTNKIINSVIQTFRNENIIVLFTVPYLSFIDPDSRKLIHAFFQTQKIDKKKKICKVKPFNIQVNQISGKMYRKSLRVLGENGASIKIKRISLNLPRRELLDYYEENAAKFKREVITEARQELDKMDMEKSMPEANRMRLTARQEQAYLMWASGMTYQQVADKLRINLSTAADFINKAKKKMEFSKGNVGFQPADTASPALST